MAEDVQAAITRWAGEALGAPCEYGEFPSGAAPCAMVRVLPGDPVVRRYRAGGGVFRVAYAVYLRVRAPSQDGRVAGIELLRGLAARVERGEVPDGPVRWTGHEVTNAPALYLEEGGTGSVYQVTCQLTYLVTTSEYEGGRA